MLDPDPAPTLSGNDKNLNGTTGNELNVTGTGEESLARSTNTQTGAWAESGRTCKRRNYADIIADASDKKSVQNILYVTIQKLSEKIRPLVSDDIGKLLFEEIGIDVNEVKRVDLHSRYEHKEVFLNADVDASKYVKPDFVFKDHKVVVDTVKSQFLRVRFINVPTAVPDEELIHLSSYFGTVKDDKIYYETHSEKTNKLCGLENGNRYLFLEFIEGKSMMNYVWWEGPLSSEAATRVTITHKNQRKQCSHCLRTYQEGCPGIGDGKLCRLNNGTKMKMEVYMKNLADRIGYKTLKTEYYENLEKSENSGENNVDGSDQQGVVVDSSKTEEIRLREKIKHLEAELSSKDKHHTKKNDKLKLLGKSVLTNLEETVAKPFFEQEISRLVTQLSFTLDDDQIQSKEDGSVVINPELFKEIETKIDQLEQVEEKQVAINNLKLFRKALESRIQAFPTADGGRRLSIGGRSNISNSSLKRKIDTEQNSRNMKIQSSNIQKPSTGKIKSGLSRKQSQITMDLVQFQSK